jgi:dipeptidyl aminopeptidase/acylaminoacyl peptidase
MRVAGPVVMYRCVLLFAWFGPGWPLPAAERMPTPQPVREYAREHEVTGVSLSPDGRTLAYQVGEDRTWVLQFRDWDSGKVTTVNAGAAPGVPLWLGPDRVLYGRGASVDRTGRNAALNGPAPGTVLFHRFAGARSDEVLAQAHELPVPGAYQEHYIPRYSHVDRVNTRLGRSIREVENPGQIVLWLADGRGAVAVGVRDDGIRHAVVRQTEPAGAWTPLAGLEDILYRVRVHGLSGDGRTLWLTRPDEKGRWALYAYDVAKQAFAELLLAHDYFDILPNLVVSPRDRELLGVRWLADKPGTFWWHGELAGVQQALDKALPGTVNHIVSLSDDLQRMVVLAVSARNPGVYFQFDRAKVELKPLFAVRPWVDPARTAECHPVSFATRDGLTVHGYLTIPAGREAKQLPLVVRPNAEFSARAFWGHDVFNQFLASRGYAMLQINARGSSGYGDDFYRRGRRRVGREVQADIADGAKWAIAQGIADPQRIAIVGENEGGYSALMNVAQNPGLYRAAVSIDGIVDWPRQLEHVGGLHPALLARAKEMIGDPDADRAELSDTSPSRHVDRIEAPVLLINGNSGTTSREAARAFAAALRQTKRPHEIVAKFDDLEGLLVPRQRAEVLARIESFLGKHLAVPRAP